MPLVVLVEVIIKDSIEILFIFIRAVVISLIRMDCLTSEIVSNSNLGQEFECEVPSSFSRFT